ncbi:MAG: acyltransferase [Prolixibacteraceae bacterium]|jgi:acetyltransferase-like isoleucine patch superfamily enzyme|nr:acyltransferase [Bacteroidota bacterium]MBT4969324.1 acyltransferase [Bacteroidota bacterium]MBT6006119.1 acyltransferase [Prolixibacteraceae bacterium]MBT7393256.1 acyltransferase [Prolixibacteraceae bacterium]
MRKNIIQSGNKNSVGETVIQNDWFNGTIPANVQLGQNVFIDSSFGFSVFNSKHPDAMKMGFAAASYNLTVFATSKNGQIEIGDYSIVNGCNIICSQKIHIGKYVMIAWGTVIYDNYLSADLHKEERMNVLIKNANLDNREMPFSRASPVFIEDNVWIGFDAVIKPGTTIGRGSVIGSKAVISGKIKPYSVVVGNPGRIIKTLNPTDKDIL